MSIVRSAAFAVPALLWGCMLPAVVTQHNDAFRTGANLRETALTIDNVTWSRFGQVATLFVDGDVYAQPLYLPRVRTRNSGQRDLVFVATANNTLYAFDANESGRPSPVWTRAYGNAVPMPSDDFANLEKTCQSYTDNTHGFPPEAARIMLDNHVGYNMRQIGITSTPVIDPKTNTIYFVTFSRDDKPTRSGPCMDFWSCTMQASCDHPIYGYHYWLHAVDVTSGDERPQSPKEITGSAPGTSAGSDGRVVTFQPTRQLQRAALLLAQNPRPAIYLAFSGHGDVGYYHGWVFAYDPATLSRLAVFLDAPVADSSYPRSPPLDLLWLGAEDGGEQGGIWQSGQGPVADVDGNVYIMSGNGSSTDQNLGDSFIKLRLDGRALTVVSHWSPTPNERDDNDLGSAGPLLVENGTLLIGGGKYGVVYILDRNLSLKQRFRAVIPPAGSSCDVAPKACGGFTRHIHGSPIYWKGAEQTFLYVWGENDCLRAYPLVAGRVPASPNQCIDGPWPWDGTLDAPTVGDASSFSSDLAPRPGMPGGILALSAGGNRGGSAMVWASRPLSGTALQNVPPAVLEAFDATNVGRRLWASEQVVDDSVGKLARFTSPTIANGRVFMATFSNSVNVYGVLAKPRVASGGAVTVLSRNSGDASLYRVAADGNVHSTWWDGHWHPWFPIGGHTGWALAGTQVTPLSRKPDDASIYVVSSDGGVHSNWWSDGTWHDWFRIGDSFTTTPGAPIKALSRNDSDASLYVVGSDGGVYSNRWSDGKWHDWFRIGTSFVASAGSAIDAISRDSSDASIYVVGSDGGVYSNRWSDGNWHDWFRIGNSFTVPQASPVHALSRNASDASIYVVGSDGGVYSNWWSDGNWHDWFRIGGAFVVPNGAHVKPLSVNDSYASIYVVGSDGGVYGNWWFDGEWHDWFQIEFATAIAGALVSPLSRQSSDASLYVVGVDGIVRSTFLTCPLFFSSQYCVWQPWFTITD
jgi:hypothetical protein